MKADDLGFTKLHYKIYDLLCLFAEMIAQLKWIVNSKHTQIYNMYNSWADE